MRNVALVALQLCSHRGSLTFHWSVLCDAEGHVLWRPVLLLIADPGAVLLVIVLLLLPPVWLPALLLGGAPWGKRIFCGRPCVCCLTLLLLCLHQMVCEVAASMNCISCTPIARPPSRSDVCTASKLPL